MAHLPRVMCADCDVTMQPHKIGVTVQANIRDGNRPYCRVQADIWRCPKCLSSVYAGMGEPLEPHQQAYKELTPARTVLV